MAEDLDVDGEEAGEPVIHREPADIEHVVDGDFEVEVADTELEGIFHHPANVASLVPRSERSLPRCGFE